MNFQLVINPLLDQLISLGAARQIVRALVKLSHLLAQHSLRVGSIDLLSLGELRQFLPRAGDLCVERRQLAAQLLYLLSPLCQTDYCFGLLGRPRLVKRVRLLVLGKHSNFADAALARDAVDAFEPSRLYSAHQLQYVFLSCLLRTDNLLKAALRNHILIVAMSFVAVVLQHCVVFIINCGLHQLSSNICCYSSQIMSF